MSLIPVKLESAFISLSAMAPMQYCFNGAMIVRRCPTQWL